MIIGGIQKFSLIDYPEKISAVIFTQGCNFRCSYCHNSQLLPFAEDFLIEESSVLSFLKSRTGKLDAVVISGGEPCLQKDLPELIQKIKGLGFAVKLDTNGSYPEVLQGLINDNLLDYIAMDIKSPFYKYESIIKYKINPDNILKSIDIIKNSGVNYEFRTTVLKTQLAENDFIEIGKLIDGAKKYYLQKYVPLHKNENFMNYSDAEFLEVQKILSNYVLECFVR